MKEKKEIKVKLSTVIIIFLVLIIIGLIALLCLQNNKMDNTNNEIAKKSGSIIIELENEKNLENLKGPKLIQFDTNFFDLDTIALVEKELRMIDKKLTYYCDLDGDGTKEEIAIESNDVDYNFKLKGKEFFTNGAFKFYIVDLNENDKTLEIIITGYAGSDRSEYIVFSKVGNEMIEHETNISGITGDFMLDRKGKIVSGEFASSVYPSVYSEYYMFENGKIIEHKLDITDIKDIEFEAGYNTYYFSKEIDTLNKIEDYMDGR